MACGLGALVVGPLLHRTAGWATDARTTPSISGTALIVSAAALVGAHVGRSWLLPAHLWLLAMAVVLTITDLTHRRLPNAVVAPGGCVLAVLLAVGAVGQGRVADLGGAALWAATLFTTFLLAALVAPRGMGMGDVKLVAVLGLMLGFAGGAQVWLALILAAALHAGVATILLVSGRAQRHTGLPFGPALLVGTGTAIGWLNPLLTGL